jgi:signal transduction histidine kinase
MRAPQPTQARDSRLVRYVLVGLGAGIAFVAFDLYSESLIGEGSISPPHASLHFVVDHVLPLIVGPLLGVAAHYLKLRSRLSAAEQAAARAEALRTRLHKVERDQALWVLTAKVLHEVNNPLQALGLLLDELAREPDDDARRDLLERAVSQSERIRVQLERLRAMQGRTEPHLEEVPLEAMLREITEDAKALAAEEGLTVKFDSVEPVVTRSEPAYIRTIVESLLDNSLHALRAQGRGTIRITLSTDGSRAIIRVHDDGPELNETARRSLFEPLVSTKEAGLGLGLPIARSLARTLGGDLELEGAAATTFRLELPLVRSELS